MESDLKEAGTSNVTELHQGRESDTILTYFYRFLKGTKQVDLYQMI